MCISVLLDLVLGHGSTIIAHHLADGRGGHHAGHVHHGGAQLRVTEPGYKYPLGCVQEMDVSGCAEVPAQFLDDLTLVRILEYGLGEFADGDEIQIWDASANNYVFRTWNTTKGGWCEGRTFSTTPIAPGTAFWLKTPGRSVSVTLAGAVPVEESLIDLNAGFQMIAANSPIALSLNDLTWTNLTDGDEVQFIKPGEQDYTFYIYNTAKGGWCKGRTLLTKEDAIPVGSSLWLKVANSNATVKIPAAL